MTDDLGVQRFPVHIEQRVADDALLDTLRKKRIYDDTILDEHDPFFWRMRISNTRVDSHFTHMMPSTLKNYAKEANAGVPFQDSHKTDSQRRTLGRSLTGEYVPMNEDRYAEVMADFYTLRGIDPDKDLFIDNVRGGFAQDGSVGFMPGQYICNICGRDMLEWNMDNWEDNCWHYPGFRYKKSTDKDAERVLCTAAVENAHLVEVSTVYAGSTPGAMIVRAERLIDAGKMPAQMARAIESRYNVRLLGARQVYLPALSREERMEEQTALGNAPETETAPEAEPTAEIREDTPAVVNDTPRSPSEAEQGFDATRALLMSRNLLRSTSVVDSVRALIEERDSLIPQADDGRKYRASLIDEALIQGARAYGGEFREELYRGMLTTLPIDNIRQMRDDWKRTAEQIIPKGRRTLDAGDEYTTAETRDPSLHRA